MNNQQKIAWILGINGQDGSYLTELLLEKGYQVFGTIRRASSINTARIDHLHGHPRLKLYYGDLTDAANLIHTLQDIRHRYGDDDNDDLKRLEIYNLAAQSHVKVSFEVPEYTAQVDAIGTLRLLEAIRSCHMEHIVRFYQASSSEMYGKVQEVPQTETTPFYPRSPYGVAKLYSYWIIRNYRESYDMFLCNGLLFNHESPRRGPTFLTRKVTIGLSKILSPERKEQELVLGNLDAKRDWGHARDYCRAMWLMLQADRPDDYVVATGKTWSVRTFVETAFKLVGIELVWRGEGVDEVGYDRNDPDERVYIRVDERYYRPAEVDLLLGDATKARKELGWQPEVDFQSLVEDMVKSDLEEYGVKIN